MGNAGSKNVVNFNRFKKQAKRGQAEKLASANRAKFGRTKAERARDERAAERLSGLLDQHRLGDENAS